VGEVGDVEVGLLDPHGTAAAAPSSTQGIQELEHHMYSPQHIPERIRYDFPAMFVRVLFRKYQARDAKSLRPKNMLFSIP